MDNNNAKINPFYTAIAFAGIQPGTYKTNDELEVAVSMRAVKIKQISENENSLPNRILNAIPIRATVKRVEFEETSQRYKIFFIAVNNEDEHEEMIRTDRMDGKHYMDEEYIKSLTDHICIIYKTNEKSDNAKIMGAGYRITPYIKKIAKADQSK